MWKSHTFLTQYEYGFTIYFLISWKSNPLCINTCTTYIQCINWWVCMTFCLCLPALRSFVPIYTDSHRLEFVRQIRRYTIVISASPGGTGCSQCNTHTMEEVTFRGYNADHVVTLWWLWRYMYFRWTYIHWN